VEAPATVSDRRADFSVQCAERVDHRVDRARARLEDGGRVEGDPAEAHGLELDDALHHAVRLRVEALPLGIARRRGDHALHADRRRIAPGGLRVAADRVEDLARALRVADAATQPAVTQLPDAPVGGLRVAAYPDGQLSALRRLGLHRHGGDGVVLAGEVDLRVAPARAQQPDRLVHPGTARVEALAERLVLGLLPSHADAEPDTAGGERVEGTDLLRHQRGLSLR
jgi:hypothetical protein